MTLPELIQAVNRCIALLFMMCYAYQLFYVIVPAVKKERTYKSEKLHKYAVLICARNERAVIGHLIDTVKSQNYPSELVSVFVAADNCTDDTADVARKAGATVYERFNKTLVGKGYALDWLTQRIDEDFGWDSFDGYFVFDADNLLDKNYISAMNETFSQGYSIVTSYRNSKNYGHSWISAGYALWFLREAAYLNRSRMLLGTSSAVSGTGFLFSRDVLKKCGGWKFFLLTEDIEFTVHNILGGETIGYCGNAVLYDEQPVTLSQSWRQRLRWARGYLQVFGKYGARLLSGIFKKGSFACYDMAMTIMPAFVLMVFSTVFNLFMTFYGLFSSQGALIAAGSVFYLLKNSYGLMFILGAVTTFTEWRNIHTTAGKKLLYMFTFPIFMFTYIPISCQALFSKVEWKPIEHTVSITIDEVKNQG